MSGNTKDSAILAGDGTDPGRSAMHLYTRWFEGRRESYQTQTLPKRYATFLAPYVRRRAWMGDRVASGSPDRPEWGRPFRICFVCCFVGSSV
jgi:hypothetical protein